MNIGLKLWSINTDFYFAAAKSLYEQGYFDYIELYVVPDTLHTLQKWETISIPFTIHAPHFMHDVNLAKREKEKYNLAVFREVAEFSAGLNAQYVIVHGGMDGEIDETIKQLKNIVSCYTSFNDNNSPLTSRLLIENKPFRALPNTMGGEFCRGATIEEIKMVTDEIGCGFCLDIGHAICSANSLHRDPYQYVAELNQLNPTCYHLSDGLIDSEYDKHLHFGAGNYDFKQIFAIIDTGKNIAIETQKDSQENLDDFIEDVKRVRGELFTVHQ